MKLLLLTFTVIFWASQSEAQDSKIIKGIATNRTGTPIPYCTVSIKGTKKATTTNNCGEFELSTNQSRCTIVFSCMSTHDFVTFERALKPQEFYDEVVIFQINNHGKFNNKDCETKVYKKKRKLVVY
jgi:hypothetical protein